MSSMPPLALATHNSAATSGEVEVAEAQIVKKVASLPSLQVVENVHEYRVYKRRWVGLIGLFLLNISAGASFRSAFPANLMNVPVLLLGMNWLWFAPINVTGKLFHDVSRAWTSCSVN